MRYVIVTPIPFALTPDQCYAVDELWGWYLTAELATFNHVCVFAPLSATFESYEFPYIFPKDVSITFYPLPHFANRSQFLIRWPKILYVLSKNIRREDLVHSVGSVRLPVGITAHILCLLRGHKKRIFVLDEDYVTNIALTIQSENDVLKKAAFVVIRPLYEFIIKFCIATAPLTFVVGAALYKSYEKYGNVRKIHASWVRKNDILVPMQIEEKLKNGLERGRCKILFAGRLIYIKGPLIAVKAVKVLKERGVPVALDIYGQGALLRELQDFVTLNDLSDGVTFKGVLHYASFYPMLKQYDAIVIPNISGEQPRIIFDAMANGVAVVGSEIDSFTDIISHGVNGLLCTAGNPESFAFAIECLFKNKQLLTKILHGGIKTVEENTIELTSAKRRQIIESVFYNR
jgi:glycosyltransferase involved in cell wall biosynthesis